jgi:hypothetical protein
MYNILKCTTGERKGKERRREEGEEKSIPACRHLVDCTAKRNNG